MWSGTPVAGGPLSGSELTAGKAGACALPSLGALNCCWLPLADKAPSHRADSSWWRLPSAGYLNRRGHRATLLLRDCIRCGIPATGVCGAKIRPPHSQVSALTILLESSAPSCACFVAKLILNSFLSSTTPLMGAVEHRNAWWWGHLLGEVGVGSSTSYFNH